MILWVSEVRSHMNLGHLEQCGQVGVPCITGKTPDISHIANFAFYQWIWYHTSPGDTGEKLGMKLGHWCGPSFDVGDILCNEVLSSKASLHKTSVFPLKAEETALEEIKQMKAKWDAELREKLGDPIKGISIGYVEIDIYIRTSHWEATIPEYQRYEDVKFAEDEKYIPPANHDDTDDPAEIHRWTSAGICSHAWYGQRL